MASPCRCTVTVYDTAVSSRAARSPYLRSLCVVVTAVTPTRNNSVTRSRVRIP
jgi:hypothetical protein